MTLAIPADQISSKRKVGHLEGGDAILVTLKGGLNVLAHVAKSGKTSVLGAGSHRAIAIHLAQKAKPDLVIDQLNKSEFVPVSAYERYLPKYQLITDMLAEIYERQQQGG